MGADGRRTANAACSVPRQACVMLFSKLRASGGADPPTCCAFCARLPNTCTPSGMDCARLRSAIVNQLQMEQAEARCEA
jgi:hypothetical protein